MPAYNTGELTLPNTFSNAANDNEPNRSKRHKPETKNYTLRLTLEEREYLEAKAGKRPLSKYCRDVLLGNYAQKRRTLRKPTISDTQYASLLAALGESRLSSNLNQLAKHANMGTIDVSDNVEQQLQEAYQVILEMRKALFIALGLKTG